MELCLKGTESQDSRTLLTSTLYHSLLYVLALFVPKLKSLTNDILYNHVDLPNAHAKDAECILYTRGMSLRTLSRGSGRICALLVLSMHVCILCVC
jgi:hypothetical protein